MWRDNVHYCISNHQCAYYTSSNHSVSNHQCADYTSANHRVSNHQCAYNRSPDCLHISTRILL